MRVENIHREQVLNPAVQRWERQIRVWEIDFSTPYGLGRGTFVDDEPPKQYEDYDVEFSIEESLTWGIGITEIAATVPAISSYGEVVKLQGTLESVDKDGYAVIRLGDSIITFTTHGEPQCWDASLRRSWISCCSSHSAYSTDS